MFICDYYKASSSLSSLKNLQHDTVWDIKSDKVKGN